MNTTLDTKLSSQMLDKERWLGKLGISGKLRFDASQNKRVVLDASKSGKPFNLEGLRS